MNREYVTACDSDFSSTMHLACVGTEALKIVCSTQLPARRAVVIVVEIQIGQMRKVDVRQGEVCVVMRIVFRERNIGVSAQRTGKDVPAKIEDLQPIIGKKQSRRDSVERQRFPKKDVVHSIYAIRFDLQMRVLTAAKLVNAIGGDIRWPPKFVRCHSLRKLGVDPENCFDW